MECDWQGASRAKYRVGARKDGRAMTLNWHRLWKVAVASVPTTSRPHPPMRGVLRILPVTSSASINRRCEKVTMVKVLFFFG